MKAHERISPGKKSQPLAYLPLKWPLFGTLGGPCLGTLPLLVCYTLCTTSKAVNHLPTWYYLTLHDAWFLLDDLIPPYFGDLQSSHNGPASSGVNTSHISRLSTERHKHTTHLWCVCLHSWTRFWKKNTYHSVKIHGDSRSHGLWSENKPCTN